MSTGQDDGENHEQEVLKCTVCCEEEYEGSPYFVALPCEHSWCLDCLKFRFSTAYNAGLGQPPTCCGEIEVTPEILELLTPEVACRYLQARMEHKAAITSYCHSCSEFIPEPFVVGGKIATCPKCMKFTCSPCGKPWHDGECVEDPDVTETMKLAKRNGWKKCPGCKTVIEHAEGCPSME